MNIIKDEISSPYSKNTFAQKWHIPDKYVFICLATTALFIASSVKPVHAYEIVPIGLTNSLDNPDISLEFNTLHDINNSTSQVAGTAARFHDLNNTSYVPPGQNTWLYNGITTETIGLVGAEYTRSDNFQYSQFTTGLNDAGQIAGYSQLFTNTPQASNSAWVYNGVETVRLGLYDDAHTRSDGYQYSRTNLLNQSGLVAGYSTSYTIAYYDGSTTLGQTAWLYDGTNTIELGYTTPDGSHINRITGLNEAGIALGNTTSSSGSGSATWLYNGTSTISLGLKTGVHVGSGNRTSASASLLNEAGHVAGTSARYDTAQPTLSTGNSAWLYNGSETVQIGLYDTEHTNADGRISNATQLMNENSQVVGLTSRYNGGNVDMGFSAWYFDGTSTTKVGLTDALHTRNDGYMSASALSLNEAGQVAGSAVRYAGAESNIGQSVWLYDGDSSFEVGLSGGLYTNENGYQVNKFLDMNESGQIVGYAFRDEFIENGNTYLGQGGWLYDNDLKQTFELVFSVSSTGEANTYIEYLGDDGLVLGQYQLYNDTGAILGRQAFSYTIDEGFFDLGSMLDTTLDEAGWLSLANAIRANDAGSIVGDGFLLDGTSSLFLMNPTVTAVPVPAAVWLFGSGLIALVSFAKRKKV